MTPRETVSLSQKGKKQTVTMFLGTRSKSTLDIFRMKDKMGEKTGFFIYKEW